MKINKAIAMFGKTELGNPIRNSTDDWQLINKKWHTSDHVFVNSKILEQEINLTPHKLVSNMLSHGLNINDGRLSISGSTSLSYTPIGFVSLSELRNAELFLDFETEKLNINSLEVDEFYIDRDGSIIKYLGINDKMKERVLEIRISISKIRGLFIFRDSKNEELTEFIKAEITDVFLTPKEKAYKKNAVSKLDHYSWLNFDGVLETLKEGEFQQFKEILKQTLIKKDN